MFVFLSMCYVVLLGYSQNNKYQSKLNNEYILKTVQACSMFSDFLGSGTSVLSLFYPFYDSPLNFFSHYNIRNNGFKSAIFLQLTVNFQISSYQHANSCILSN